MMVILQKKFHRLVLWWINGGLKYEPEQLDQYFRYVLKPAVQE